MNLFELLRNRRLDRTAVAARRRHAAGRPLPSGAAARTAATANQETLSSAARAWIAELPAALRPHELCGAYPRVANRIALCWSDLSLADAVFNGLLLDERGGREGFPARVAAELLRLHAFHQRRSSRLF